MKIVILTVQKGAAFLYKMVSWRVEFMERFKFKYYKFDYIYNITVK